MRKILIGIVLLGLGVFNCYAGQSGETSLQPYQDIVILGSDTLGIYQVSCATETATQLRPANTDRQGIVIQNQNTDADHDIYLSTYAATSISGLYLLSEDSEFEDSIEAYTGAWYGISSTNTAKNVVILEKE